MPIVLVCGDRNWMDRELIERSLKERLEPGDVVLHGDCRGADRLAGEVAKELGYAVETMPADWYCHQRAAGPIRNRQMLLRGPRLVLAFHDDLSRSKGTRDMVGIARAAKVPVMVYSHAEGW